MVIENSTVTLRLCERNKMASLSQLSLLARQERAPMEDLPARPIESTLAIETDRLELRPIRQEDAQILFPVLSDPTLYEYTGGAPPASVEELRNIYASREACRSPDGKELWLNWMIRERSRGDALGYIQATVSAVHADVAWVVGSSWQGRGFASEAARAIVEWLCAFGVTKIRAKIHPQHVASRKVALNCGFRCTKDTSDGEELWILGTTPGVSKGTACRATTP